MDFVFTVCDDAAKEVCPIWPGQPMTAHWGVPDPSTAKGTEAEKRLAFANTYRMLQRRIDVFISLPLKSLARLALQKEIDKDRPHGQHPGKGVLSAFRLWSGPSPDQPPPRNCLVLQAPLHRRSELVPALGIRSRSSRPRASPGPRSARRRRWRARRRNRNRTG